MIIINDNDNDNDNDFQVRLKCLATIAGLYWKTADVTLSQEHPKLLQTRDGIFPCHIFIFLNFQGTYIGTVFSHFPYFHSLHLCSR